MAHANCLISIGAGKLEAFLLIFTLDAVFIHEQTNQATDRNKLSENDDWCTD